MLVNVLEAKTNLSKLMAAAVAGEEVILANRGQPIVRLVPVEEKPHRTTGFGAWAHIKQPKGYDDFSEVNAELWRAMEASDIFAGANQREAQLKLERKRAKTPATKSKSAKTAGK
jgi:prevent-host-death family protein